MAAALKASAKPFRNEAACAHSVTSLQCWHQAQVRTPCFQLLRDGDLIPCSKTICLGRSVCLQCIRCRWKSSKTNKQGPFFLRGMAAALKASAKPFRNEAACVRSVSALQCWHQAQVRTPWFQMLRDGDLIPCSMSICI